MLLSVLIIQRICAAYENHIRDMSPERLLAEQGALHGELARFPGEPGRLQKMVIVKHRLRLAEIC